MMHERDAAIGHRPDPIRLHTRRTPKSQRPCRVSGASASCQSESSRRLVISRDTIHRLIRLGELDRDVDAEPVRYELRPPVSTKLEPYRAMIVARPEASPRLSSVRLLEEARAAGYT